MGSIRFSLERLEESLKKDLDISPTSSMKYWRTLPPDVDTAYTMMQSGAELVHSTSTKTTLLTKAASTTNPKDVAAVQQAAQDLLKGCQCLATGAMVLCNDDTGCGRPVRSTSRHATRAVVHACLVLMETLEKLAGPKKKKNVGAPETGIVWNACDAITKLPKGNRAACRRELLTYTKECNETMQEFQQSIDNQAQSPPQDGSQEGEDTTSWQDFLQGQGEEYQSSEIPVVEGCLAVIKCSRGSMNVTLQSCECLGQVVEDEQSGQDERQSVLEWMTQLHRLARDVGEGMTDLGAVLYAPLDMSSVSQQAQSQTKRIVELHQFVLEQSKDSQAHTHLTEEIQTLSSNILKAVQCRCNQVLEAIPQPQETNAATDST